MITFVKRLMVLMLLAIAYPLWAGKFPAPDVVKVNERVYVLLGPIQHANPQNQGYMINSTIIIGDKGVLLVDPGGTDEIGEFIKQHVRKLSNKPITHVINTHSHGDHYLGNIAFPDATIISSEQSRELVIQTGEEWVQMMESMVGRKFPNTKPVAASLVYPPASKTTVTLHGITLVFWVPPGSHMEGDLMLYLPEDKVLISGDILVNGIVPTLQDGFIKNWIAVLAEIEHSGAQVFVPGHGALMSREQVKSLREVISRFYAAVQEGYRANLSESEIRARLDLSAWEKLERAYVIGRNINRAYLEAEQELF